MPSLHDYNQGWPRELVRQMEAQASVDATATTSELQLSVKDKDRHTPPSSPANGDRYIVASGATGAWAGRVGYVAEYVVGADTDPDLNPGSWWFTAPADGMVVWVSDEDLMYTYTGSVWVVNPSTRETQRFFVSGTVSAGAEQGGVWFAPAAGVITSVSIYRKSTAGTSGSTIVDVNVNENTVFTNQANRPSIAYNDADRRAVTATVDFGLFAQGDMISVDVDQIDTGGSPSNLTVVINVLYNVSAISVRSHFDGVYVTDTLGPSVEKGPSDTMAVTDTLSATEMEYERPLVDSAIAITETFVRATDTMRGFEESIAMTDTLGPSVEKGPSDTAVVTDDVLAEKNP